MHSLHPLHSSLDKSSSSAGQSSPAHSRASSAERQRDTVERLSQPRHSSQHSPSARRAWGSPARPDSRGAASDMSRRRPASPQLHRPQSGIAGLVTLPMRPPPLATLVLWIVHSMCNCIVAVCNISQFAEASEATCKTVMHCWCAELLLIGITIEASEVLQHTCPLSVVDHGTLLNIRTLIDQL